MKLLLEQLCMLRGAATEVVQTATAPAAEPLTAEDRSVARDMIIDLRRMLERIELGACITAADLKPRPMSDRHKASSKLPASTEPTFGSALPVEREDEAAAELGAVRIPTNAEWQQQFKRCPIRGEKGVTLAGGEFE